MTQLARPFFARPPDRVARDLLGQRLVREDEGRRLAGRIVETEAYGGPDDPASHARFGPTDRAAVMWDRPGTVYVYVIYGVHHMLNLVTGAKGDPGAVLVRAVEPLEGVEAMRARRGVEDEGALTDGPGKLCQALRITLDDGGLDAAAEAAEIRVEKGSPPDRIERTGRIGVVEDLQEPLRFVDAGSPWVGRG